MTEKGRSAVLAVQNTNRTRYSRSESTVYSTWGSPRCSHSPSLVRSSSSFAGCSSSHDYRRRTARCTNTASLIKRRGGVRIVSSPSSVLLFNSARFARGLSMYSCPQPMVLCLLGLADIAWRAYFISGKIHAGLRERSLNCSCKDSGHLGEKKPPVSYTTTKRIQSYATIKKM